MQYVIFKRIFSTIIECKYEYILNSNGNGNLMCINLCLKRSSVSKSNSIRNRNAFSIFEFPFYVEKGHQKILRLIGEHKIVSTLSEFQNEILLGSTQCDEVPNSLRNICWRKPFVECAKFVTVLFVYPLSCFFWPCERIFVQSYVFSWYNICVPCARVKDIDR